MSGFNKTLRNWSSKINKMRKHNPANYWAGVAHSKKHSPIHSPRRSPKHSPKKITNSIIPNYFKGGKSRRRYRKSRCECRRSRRSRK